MPPSMRANVRRGVVADDQASLSGSACGFRSQGFSMHGKRNCTCARYGQ